MPKGPLARRLIAAAVLVLSGCAAPRPTTAPASYGIPIAVIDRGWHTDLAVPAGPLPASLQSFRQPFSGVRWLVFGFGDRFYYMARKVTLATTLATLFPGSGVVLVTGLSAPPEAAFGAAHLVRLQLSVLQFQSLAAYIARTVQPVQRLAPGPYPGSLFYASTDTYDALRDCNEWTAAGLAAAGEPVTPAGVIFASQVMAQVRPLAARR